MDKGIHDEKKERIKRRRAALLGSAFIAVGLPGLVLPFLQGVLLIAIGLVFFSLYSRWLALKLEVVKKRYPRTERIIRMAQRKAATLLAVE